MRTNKIKVAFAVTLLASSATAQQLEPRRYQNVPVGVNALAFTYGFSTGNVLFDSTLPIEDATADVHMFAVLYLLGGADDGTAEKARAVTELVRPIMRILCGGEGGETGEQ